MLGLAIMPYRIRYKQIAFWFGAAVILTTALQLDNLLVQIAMDRPIQLSSFWDLTGISIWLLFFPIIRFLVICYAMPAKRKLLQRVLLHLTASFLFAATHLWLNITLSETLYKWIGTPVTLANPSLFVWRLTWRIIIYFLIVSVIYLLENHYRLKRKELEVLQKEASLSKLEFAAVAAYINPDSIQTSLQEISESARKDIRATRKKIAALGDHLRLKLKSAPTFSMQEETATAVQDENHVPGIQASVLSKCWLIIGLFVVAREAISVYFTHGIIASGADIVQYSIPCLLWAAITPFFIRFARGHLLSGSVIFRNLALHFLCNFGIWIVSILLSTVVRMPASIEDKQETFTRMFFKSSISFHIVAYWTFLFVLHSFYFKEEAMVRQSRVFLLDRSLANARLKILTMQLRPHFLFNTLHAISGLIRLDPDEAIRMLAHLQDLMRRSLDADAPQMVPLKKELQNLTDYVAIQKARFQERLQVRFDVDSNILDHNVPNWILQPLVENAIQHGVGKRRTGGEIRISAHRHNSTLQITIQDDGPGAVKSSRNGGLGLSITRARLQHLYGSSNRFVTKSHAEGGFFASLEIPIGGTT